MVGFGVIAAWVWEGGGGRVLGIDSVSALGDARPFPADAMWGYARVGTARWEG